MPSSGQQRHTWTDCAWGGISISIPCVYGHEASGHVVAIGEGVTNVKPGDRCALLPYSFVGLMAKYISHPAANCLPLPDHVSDAEAAYNEPLAVGLNAVNRAGIFLNKNTEQNVVVVGCGPVGLATIACLLALGVLPERICATDLSAARLKAAQNYTPPAGVIPDSATQKLIHTVTTGPELVGDLAALSKAVRGVFSNKTVDIVIDAASFPSTLAAG